MLKNRYLFRNDEDAVCAYEIFKNEFLKNIRNKSESFTPRIGLIAKNVYIYKTRWLKGEQKKLE